jgi:hypothetical protein
MSAPTQFGERLTRHCLNDTTTKQTRLTIIYTSITSLFTSNSLQLTYLYILTMPSTNKGAVWSAASLEVQPTAEACEKSTTKSRKRNLTEGEQSNKPAKKAKLNPKLRQSPRRLIKLSQNPMEWLSRNQRC